MSSLRYFSDDRRLEKAPEKTNFVQTCNLLSRYMKEKGSLRDLNLEIGGKVESLQDIVKPGSYLAASTCAMSSLTSKEEISRKVGKNKAQLTIFYSGKVLVFEDYSVDKVRELVSVAKKSGSKMSYGILSNTLPEKPKPGILNEGLPPRPKAGISSNTCEVKMNWTANADVASSSRSKEQISTQSEANGSDLPIARRSSVHRFMEKRKERAAVRGPYQNQEQRHASSSKDDQQFDLNI